MRNDIRYGIFLRPDPATCWAVTQTTLALKQQYGFVAAAAFAPHATLIGNFQSSVSEAELITTLDRVFAGVRPYPVYNSGIERAPRGNYWYDVNLDAAGAEPNQPLNEIAARVKSALLPLHVPHNDRFAPNVADYTFAGHIGLASFELIVDPRLSVEVGGYLAELPISAPSSFEARWYSLFQFRADWQGPWWENMPWRHVKSWRAEEVSAGSGDAPRATA
ncbi:hypothetical protein JNB62_05240 [Microbacterium jejuense]|uniref:2'-5' RNA ligase family protein n=1 Tax=Microbacterium jejuense TaxID=1263637 RepID=A0ABS7HJF8_9MICO|nr:hypothetical protein [Microbacterium jejuense]MBW9093079.1 hypothetical protein [Microbacterium jejuense]